MSSPKSPSNEDYKATIERFMNRKFDSSPASLVAWIEGVESKIQQLQSHLSNIAATSGTRGSLPAGPLEPTYPSKENYNGESIMPNIAGMGGLRIPKYFQEVLDEVDNRLGTKLEAKVKKISSKVGNSPTPEILADELGMFEDQLFDVSVFKDYCTTRQDLESKVKCGPNALQRSTDFLVHKAKMLVKEGRRGGRPGFVYFGRPPWVILERFDTHLANRFGQDIVDEARILIPRLRPIV